MESIGRLAGGVAHDFNNMLGVILGYLELVLEDCAESDPRRPDLLEIQSAARRSSEITQQLLTCARKETINPRPIDLSETVAGMIKMLERLIGEEIELDWQRPDKLWRVELDPHQVNQMLINLCVNARDAIEGPGVIAIRIENKTIGAADSEATAIPAGDYVVLAVSDSGCGMDESTRQQIFEPFFTTKRQGKGTGLGLSTVYGIVRQNEGFIEVDSEPAHGTTFQIYLRRHHLNESAVERDDPDVLADGQGEIILLVEDETAMLDVTTRLLQRLDYRVLPAGSRQEAMRLARQYGDRIRVLLTDVVMPEQDGHGLAQEIRRIIPTVRVLYMSGYPDDVITAHGVSVESAEIIAKPFDVTELSARIRRALSERS